jgi:ribonuclease HII
VKIAERTGSLGTELSAACDFLFSEMHILCIGLDFEKQALSEGYRLIAGVDEVGRGCLAGPVVAAACILDPDKELPEDLDDSKKLTPEQRVCVAEQLRSDCVAYAIGQVEADEIDRINILQATKKAMMIAVDGLSPAADFLLIDALQLKQCRLPQLPIIRGDAMSASIAAASIIAKVYRDNLMSEYHRVIPQYGFNSHKGYAASSHYDAIREYGPSELHRLTFKGVVSDEGEPGSLFDPMTPNDA